jgi:predicted NBD/HSP70 family sugar kinase
VGLLRRRAAGRPSCGPRRAWRELIAERGAELTTRDCHDLAAAGDPTALALFTAAGRRLGQAVASLVNVLAPDRVIIGGGVAQAGDFLLAPCREMVAKHVMSEAGATRPSCRRSSVRRPRRSGRPRWRWPPGTVLDDDRRHRRGGRRAAGLLWLGGCCSRPSSLAPLGGRIACARSRRRDSGRPPRDTTGQAALRWQTERPDRAASLLQAERTVYRGRRRGDLLLLRQRLPGSRHAGRARRFGACLP